MGEEEKKLEQKKVEEKEVEEGRKTPEVVEKKEEPKTDKEKSSDEAPQSNVEESQEPSPTLLPLPSPPPPQEIVLRVYLHCEGCAKKVRRCLKGFEGVEDVKTDCITHKVVVKGEQADPLKVLGRVQRKSHRKVELLSPIPPPPAEPKETEEKEIPKPPEKEEPQVTTVVLRVHMHCEACAQEIKKRIQRMKGVENANPDLKNSEVKVKGVFEASKLVEYVYKRTGKHAVVVKEEVEKKEETKEEKKGDESAEKKVEEPPAPAAADGGGEAKEKKVGEAKEKKVEGGDKEATKAEETVVAPAVGDKEVTRDETMELMKNEFYYYYPPVNYPTYPPSVVFSYPPAPQIFSDENPNACCVM